MENTGGNVYTRIYDNPAVKRLFPFIYENGGRFTDSIAYFLLMWFMLIPALATFGGVLRLIKLPALMSPFTIYNQFNLVTTAVLVFVIYQGLGWLIYAMSHDGCGGFAFKTAWEYIKAHSFETLFVVLFVWIFISALFAPNTYKAMHGASFRHEGFYTICRYAALLITLKLLKNQNKRRALLTCFTAATLYMSAIMACQHLFPDAMNMLFMRVGLSGIFTNSNHAAYYITMGATVLAGMAVKEKRPCRCALYCLAFCFEVWTLIQNDTLGCFVAVTATCVIGICFFAHVTRKSVFKAVIPIVLVAALAVSMSMTPNTAYGTAKVKDNIVSLSTDIKRVMSYMFKTSDSESKSEGLSHDEPIVLNIADMSYEDSSEADSSADSAGTYRWGLWRYAVKFILERPIFGWGPEQLGDLYERTPLFMPPDRPHNEYLQYAASYGIPGLAMYLAALICLFSRQIKRVKALPNYACFSACGVIGYLISAFFGVSMYYTFPYFLLLLGLSSTPGAEEPMSAANS